MFNWIFSFIRRIYNWTLSWAEHHRSVYALGVLAFIESIFFPVPTDVLLMVMGAAKPKRALFFGLIASVFSVLGGIGGYALGYLAWHSFDTFFFQYVFSEQIFQKVGQLYNDNAFWAVFTAAFTPIPFKVFTVAAGAFEIAFMPFLLAASIGRPLRFMLVSTLLYFYGAPVRIWVEKYFNILTVLFTLLLVGGFFILKYLL